MNDNVNKPNHYTYGKYECIDVIKDITDGNEAKGIFSLDVLLLRCEYQGITGEWLAFGVKEL